MDNKFTYGLEMELLPVAICQGLTPRAPSIFYGYQTQE
jgi:hypothetical protein